MTIEEWTDEVARMTPKQKEAMGYGMEAVKIACVSYRPMPNRPHMADALTASPQAARRALEHVYPGGQHDDR